MSLSEAPSIQITYNTAQDVSDEILGGTIQFCREAGYKQTIAKLTFLWSALLLSSKEELVQNGIIEDVQRCYIRSLGNIFPKVSTDPEAKSQIESMLQQYWENLSSDFTDLRSDSEIYAILNIANKLSNDANSELPLQITEAQQKSFSRLASALRSSVYRILRKIDNGMTIQYKGVLDEIRFARIRQESNAVKQTQSNNIPKAVPTMQAYSTEKPLGMAWYKFLIYFALIAGAILNIIYGINYITGGIYFSQTNGQVSAEDVYYYYGNGLRFVDILFGLFLIAFAVFGIVLRNRLAKFKPDAPKLVYIFYAVLAGGSLLYAILVAAITSTQIGASQVLSIITSIVFLILNIMYFRKREHLFIEEGFHTQSTASTQKTAQASYNTNHTVPNTTTTSKISFCRKCGSKLLDGSQFCHKCGTKAMVEAAISEKPIKAPQITPVEKLVLLTVGLPAAIADKREEEMNIVKNQYTYCDAIIFAEFFIRANVLELAPSREVAMKFSDSFIDAVIKETINTVPDTETFFADMFYSRATLYDSIVMNSKEPIMDVVEVLTHIIHKEIADDSYVMTDDKNFRYFGGIFENLAIKTELVSLFQYINDVTEDAMKELKDYLKTL